MTYYEILGVPLGASKKDIQRAFRLLAVKYHPDKNKDPGAVQRFAEIKKAYEHLKNETKRKVEENSAPVGEPLYKSDLRVSIKVKIQDLVSCIKKNLKIKRKNSCSVCAGTGSASKKFTKCVYCDGTGLEGYSLVLGKKKACGYCKGSKTTPVGDLCLKCKGSGLAVEAFMYQLALNPYSESYNIPGLGNFDVGVKKAGNLIIDVEVEQDVRFKVKGLNVYSIIEISPALAVLGGDHPVDVFGKKVIVKVPPGTSHGQVVEISDGGIRYEHCVGFFKATLNIKIPAILTEKESELYKNLLDLERNFSWPTILSF
jgi:molecular chaperone DnaJ